MTTKTRAQTGGETGVNGEFYRGGQFLPSSPTMEKGAFKQSKRRKGTGKQEIEPYVWEIPPTETAKPVNLAMFVAMPVREGREIVGYERYEPAIRGSLKDEMFMGWHIDELIEMYNSGQRWFEPR